MSIPTESYLVYCTILTSIYGANQFYGEHAAYTLANLRLPVALRLRLPMVHVSLIFTLVLRFVASREFSR